VGKPERKRKRRRPRYRWIDNIEIDIEETVRDHDWFYLTQDMDRWRPCVKTVIYNQVP